MIKLGLIVAQSSNNIIGINNDLPWVIKEDLQFFKETTIGHPVLMGTNTFKSLKYKPLPKRLNVIITTQPELYIEYTDDENIQFYTSIEAALKSLDEQGFAKAFVIGGERMYREALTLGCDDIYITCIKKIIKFSDTDKVTYFPLIKNKFNYNTTCIKEFKVAEGPDKGVHCMILHYQR